MKRPRYFYNFSVGLETEMLYAAYNDDSFYLDACGRWNPSGLRLAYFETANHYHPVAFRDVVSSGTLGAAPKPHKRVATTDSVIEQPMPK